MHLLKAAAWASPWLGMLALYAGWHWKARACYPAHLVADCCIVALALVCGFTVGSYREALRWRGRMVSWRDQVKELLTRGERWRDGPPGERAG